MALQWMILACVVAAEAAVAVMLTLPAPRAVRKQIVGLTSMLLQPFAGILPFAAFQLLGARALASPSRGFGPRFPPSRYSALTGLLFFFLAPRMCRYLLEERAQVDVHLRDLHR